MQYEAIGPTALLCCGAVFNVLLIVSLQRTWTHWNQMKWYILMLALGNVLEVLFTLTVLLASTIQDSWLGGSVSCKSLMFLEALGPSLNNMALAASSLHALITACTRHHGNCLRHILLMLVFLLLSLPLPVSKVFTFNVLRETTLELQVIETCTDLGFFHSPPFQPHHRLYFFMASSLALLFLPLIVISGSLGGAVIVSCLGNNKAGDRHSGESESDQGDGTHAEQTEDRGGHSNTADIVLTIILGTSLTVLCVPLHVFIIFFRNPQSIHNTVQVYTILMYTFYSKVSVTAIVITLYSWVHVYRKGRKRAHARQRRIAGEARLVE